MKKPPVGGNILIWGLGIKRPLFIVCIIILIVFGIMNMAGVFLSADDTKHAIGGTLNIGSPVIPAHSIGGTQSSSSAPAPDQGIGAALKKVREMWELRLFEIFPEPEGGVLCDLLLGDKKAISGEIKDLYTRNGIAHILSISGLHISILGLGLYSLLRRTGMPIWVCALASGIFLIMYGILTGMSVSARRSIYMFILKLMADSVGRTVDKPTSFALVAVLVLAPDPSLMAECSFLLSFGSAAGIYFLSPLFTKKFDALLNKSDKIALWRRTHKNTKFYSALQWLQNSLIMSLSVTLTILPVTLWFISRNKKQKGKTVFIDARNLGYMVDRKHRDFTDEDISKIADAFTAFQNGTLEDVKGFCAVATLQDIAKQDYILTPGRYVGMEEQEDDGEPFEDKMTRLTSELSELFEKSHALEDEIRKKLGAIGFEI